jgi:hypothetical protein
MKTSCVAKSAGQIRSTIGSRAVELAIDIFRTHQYVCDSNSSFSLLRDPKLMNREGWLMADFRRSVEANGSQQQRAGRRLQIPTQTS